MGALEVLQANQDILHNQVITLHNRTALMAETTFTAMEQMKEEIEKTQRNIVFMNHEMASFYTSINRRYRQTHTVLNNHHLSIKLIQTFFIMFIQKLLQYQ